MTARGTIYPNSMENVTIRMTDDMRSALQAHAAITRRTFSDYVRLVLEQHLADTKERTS